MELPLCATPSCYFLKYYGKKKQNSLDFCRTVCQKIKRLLSHVLFFLLLSQLIISCLILCPPLHPHYFLSLLLPSSLPLSFHPSSLLLPSWQCCDLGFHLSVERVMKCYLASRWRIQKTEETGLKQLEAAVTSLDQGGDRDALLQQHDAAFCLPFRFNYHPHEGDQVKSLSRWSRCTIFMEIR